MKKFTKVLMIFMLLTGCAKKAEEVPVETVVSTPEPTAVTVEKTAEPEVKEEKDYTERNEAWDANYHITHDYVGNIKVGEIIDLPVVQGESNDTYLRRDWETMNYDEEGSIFLDYRNTLDDQNLIIYGHYVYHSYDPSGTHKFTPLDLLMKQENYEANKYVTLDLQNEIRTYEVAAVYYCGIYTANDGLSYPEPGLIYYYTDYPEDYIDEYLANVKHDQFYETGVEITRDDKFLTLQTCVEGHDELREIVLCKYISTEKTRENVLDKIG